MRLLFEIDKKNYDPDGAAFRRPSARGIIRRGGKLAMIYSRARRYYKLPGGGIEEGEDKVTAMIREVSEETGLTVVPESVREYGYVHRIQKGKHEPVFIQDNFYYFCDVLDQLHETELSEQETMEDFVLCWVEPQQAIDANLKALHETLEQSAESMITREVRLLEMLIEEKLV